MESASRHYKGIISTQLVNPFKELPERETEIGIFKAWWPRQWTTFAIEIRSPTNQALIEAAYGEGQVTVHWPAKWSALQSGKSYLTRFVAKSHDLLHAASRPECYSNSSSYVSASLSSFFYFTSVDLNTRWNGKADKVWGKVQLRGNTMGVRRNVMGRAIFKAAVANLLLFKWLLICARNRFRFWS